MKPNFLVIGAQKSATSSICDLLDQHPDVFMTTPKEPYFFSHDDVWARGWAWYERLFDGAAGCRAVGEGSTTYTQHGLYPHAPERIAEHLPEARFIFVARHPLDRIRSHWMHLRSRANRETRPFNEAVRARPEYLDHSRYDHQLSFYRRFVPEERLLVLFFRDFREDPDAVMRRTFLHLDVDPDVALDDAERPRHASAQGRVDTPVTGLLRRMPMFERVRNAAPGPLRESVRRIFKRPVGARPDWDDATRAWAIDALRDDVRAFLASAGKPHDFWPEFA